MYYTIKQFAEMFHTTEHTIRYYTDQGLLPCKRDRANRRVFDDESLNWITGIKCLKGCGMSIAAIRHYCQLCNEPSEETLRARYDIILEHRELAYQKLREAQERVAYMEYKARHYEDILAGRIPDDTNFAHYQKAGGSMA